MTTIHIEKLRLRTILGVFDWERKHRQDVVISLTLEVDAEDAFTSDELADTCDYKALTKRIIDHVEGSSYLLVEKLAAALRDLALETPRVLSALVRVEKPHALRFADNVAIEVRGERPA
jgi:FolB domain-containing protein